MLRADRNVFACYSNIQDTVYWSELGASLAIFRAGYSIDSLMLRYAEIDWLDRANHKCNARCGFLLDIIFIYGKAQGVAKVLAR